MTPLSAFSALSALPEPPSLALVVALACALLGTAFGQAPAAPPAASQPAPPPAASTPAASAALVPGTGTPLTPSAASAPAIAAFEDALDDEQKAEKTRQSFFEQAQQQILNFNQKISAFDQVAQDEFRKIKEREKWGDDVTYDLSRKTFVRGAKKETAGQPPASATPPPAARRVTGPVGAAAHLAEKQRAAEAEQEKKKAAEEEKK